MPSICRNAIRAIPILPLLDLPRSAEKDLICFCAPKSLPRDSLLAPRQNSLRREWENVVWLS